MSDLAVCYRLLLKQEKMISDCPGCQQHTGYLGPHLFGCLGKRRQEKGPRRHQPLSKRRRYRRVCKHPSSRKCFSLEDVKIKTKLLTIKRNRPRIQFPSMPINIEDLILDYTTDMNTLLEMKKLQTQRKRHRERILNDIYTDSE